MAKSKRARDIHYVILMGDGTIIEETKENSKWTIDQHISYWNRKARHEKTYVRRSMFSTSPIPFLDFQWTINGGIHL